MTSEDSGFPTGHMWRAPRLVALTAADDSLGGTVPNPTESAMSVFNRPTSP